MDTKRQLIKASTSIGANYEESQGAPTKPDVRTKIAISLKEMREANYFIRIYHHLKLGDVEKSKHLVNESTELKKILGAILTKLSVWLFPLSFGLGALGFGLLSIDNLFTHI